MSTNSNNNTKYKTLEEATEKLVTNTEKLLQFFKDNNISAGDGVNAMLYLISVTCLTPEEVIQCADALAMLAPFAGAPRELTQSPQETLQANPLGKIFN